MKMLTLGQIQQFLARFTYKPGWKITAYQADFEGPHVFIVANVENSYQPGNTIDLGIRSPIPPFDSVAGLARWLAWRLERVESHEMREWLKLDGISLYDPHDVPN